MSKSKGDFLTVSLLEEEKYNPIVYRMYCLQSHYRKPLKFDYDKLDNVALSYHKLKAKIMELDCEGTVDSILVNKYRAKFIEAMGNDLNTSSSLTILYELLKEEMNDATKLFLVKEFDTVLSLDLTKEVQVDTNQEIEDYVNEKIEERNNARKQKSYELADKIRLELLDKGIEIKDTKAGTTWKKI